MDRRTVQRRVHPANIDQQTDHCHVDSRRPIRQELILQYLATLGTPRHCLQVDVSKGITVAAVRDPVKDGSVVREDGAQEIILNVLPPQWFPVIFLQVTDLVARVHGRYASVWIASNCRTRWRGSGRIQLRL